MDTKTIREYLVKWKIPFFILLWTFKYLGIQEAGLQNYAMGFGYNSLFRVHIQQSERVGEPIQYEQTDKKSQSRPGSKPRISNLDFHHWEVHALVCFATGCLLLSKHLAFQVGYLNESRSWIIALLVTELLKYSSVLNYFYYITFFKYS